VPVTSTLNQSGLIRIPVSAEGGALTTGIYLLHITSPKKAATTSMGRPVTC